MAIAISDKFRVVGRSNVRLDLARLLLQLVFLTATVLNIGVANAMDTVAIISGRLHTDQGHNVNLYELGPNYIPFGNTDYSTGRLIATTGVVREDSSFSLQLEIQESRFFELRLQNGNLVSWLYVRPGDETHIDFVNYKAIGRGSEVMEFIWNFWRKSRSSNCDAEVNETEFEGCMTKHRDSLVGLVNDFAAGNDMPENFRLGFLAWADLICFNKILKLLGQTQQFEAGWNDSIGTELSFESIIGKTKANAYATWNLKSPFGMRDPSWRYQKDLLFRSLVRKKADLRQIDLKVLSDIERWDFILRIARSLYTSRTKDYLLFSLYEDFLDECSDSMNLNFLKSKLRTDSNAFLDSQLFIAHSAGIRRKYDLFSGNLLAQQKLEGIDGKTMILGDSLRRRNYVSIWASWCKSCIISLNSIAEDKEKFRVAGINLITINIDEGREWQKFLEGIPGSHFRSLGGWSSAIVKNIDMYALPRYLILDAEGRLIDAHAPGPSSELYELFNQ